MSEQIFESLSQLIYGQPRQATATLEMLMSSKKDFFSELMKIIIEEGSKINNNKNNQIQKAAIITLNTLAIRNKINGEIKNYLRMEQIYQCLKEVLISKEVIFENKKMLTPALSQYFRDALSTHKQIISLKQQLSLIKNPQSSLILLDAIIKSKQMHQPIKIQCILQLFQFAVGQGKKLLEIVYCWQNCEEVYFKRLNYLIDIFAGIFNGIFKEINQPYEYEALVLLSQNVQFANMMLQILEWRHPNDNKNKLRYPWLQDIKIIQKNRQQKLIQYYEINNMKQKIFLILSSIISKTNPNFNLINSQHHLIKNIPLLCCNVLKEIVSVTHQFLELNDQYIVGPLFDSMLRFLAECLNLNDLNQIFSRQLPLGEFIRYIMQFIRVRESDVKSLQDEQFADFLQGFVGFINVDEITRYGVSKLVKMCCKKIDEFPAMFFEISYNGIIDKLRERVLKNNIQNYNQQYYSNLYINISQNIIVNNYKNIQQKMDIVSYLLCMIVIQSQIKQRQDFQQNMIKLLTGIDYYNLKKQQLTLVYFILSKHTYLFLNNSLLEFLPKILEFVYQIKWNDRCNDNKNNDICTFIVCMQFIKQLYLHTIIQIPINNEISKKLLNITYNNIWKIFINISQYQLIGNNYGDNWEYFYDGLLNFVNVNHIINKINKKQYRINKQEQLEKFQLNSLIHKNTSDKIYKIAVKCDSQTIGHYLLNQISIFIFMILKNLCKILPPIILKDGHNNLIVLRIHQCIVQCLQSLDIMLSIEQNNNNNNIKVVSNRQYVQVISIMIRQIMNQSVTGEGHSISTEEMLNLLELLAMLITQERMHSAYSKASQSVIPQSLFQSLLPVMLQHSFGQNWLICLCQFVHRIQGKFEINQIYKITEMIKNGYEKYSVDQIKINELSLFTIVLLNYHQPQNWDRIHEIVRINLLKYIKIENENNLSQRKKKLLKYGFESQNIFTITTIRLFHVYLFGFKIQNYQELLQQILEEYVCFVQKYCLIQTTHFIIGLRSSYKYINIRNFQKLLDILILILNKLVINSNFYGKQSLEQSRIRKLSQKIGCMTIDPFDEFRKFVDELMREGNNLLEHPKYGHIVKNMMNVSTYMGFPRKIYSINRRNY